MTPILLLTRPEAQARAFAASCRAAGFAGAIVVSPLQAIVPVPWPGPPAPGTRLVFTSANGVRQAAAQADLRGFRAVAVGERTAQAARAAGMRAEPAGGDVEALLAALLARDDGAPLLHLHGAHATGDLAARLAAAGRRATSVVVYDQQALPLGDEGRAALAGAAPVILPLFSPRSAALAGAAAAGAGAALWPVAISAAAAAAWPGPEAVRVAARPDGAAMQAAVLALGGSGGWGSSLVAREPNS